MAFSNLTCQVFVFFIGYFSKRRGKCYFSLFTAVGNHYSPIKSYLGSWNVGVPYGLHAPWLFIWLNHIFLAYLQMQWMKIRGLLWAVCLCEGWTRVFCLVCGFIWVEEWPSGRIVFSREWKAVGLLKPACQRTNCRSNVGKEGTHREAFKWGNEEVKQDKHPTSFDLLKKLHHSLTLKSPKSRLGFYSSLTQISVLTNSVFKRNSSQSGWLPQDAPEYLCHPSNVPYGRSHAVTEKSRRDI